ncbi:MAG: TraB/GumN family protein [Gammaproteobacteria bacterium]
MPQRAHAIRVRLPRAASAAAARLATLLLVVLALNTPAGALECPPLASIAAPDTGEIVHRRGLLWRVTAPDGATSTLLGTMHVADPRVTGVRAIARTALAGAATFVMEVVLDPQALVTLQQAMFYTTQAGLRERLEPALFERASAVMREYGLDQEMVARMKPWAVFLTLSQPLGESGAALDLLLMSEAQAAGKAVVGLETVAEQVSLFEALGEDEQIDFLREMTCHHATFQAEIEQMVERYAARDLAGLVALSLKHVGAHNEAFVEALVWERNARMLARLAPLLEAGGAFVAVGALHLPGPRGLLQGLARDGYTIEMIY